MRPSTWAGTPEIICFGGLPSRSGQLRRTSSWLPPIPPLVDDHRAGAQLERADRVAVGGDAARARRRARGSCRRRRRPRRRDRQRVDAVAEAQVVEPAAARPPHERLDHARPGAPGDVEARDRVAVPDRAVPAALGPADVRHQLDALRAPARRASRPPRSRRRPRPSGAATRRRAGRSPAVPSQSCHASSRESLIRSRRCSGLSTMKSPPSDQNACPPSDASGSCSTRITRRPASASSAVATRPASPPPTTITSASIASW